MKNYRLYNGIAPSWTMVLFFLVVLVMGCRKTPAPPMVMPEVKETEVNIGQTEVKMKGNVDYPGKIFNVDMLLGRDSLNLTRYNADLDDDKSFSVLVNNLKPSRHYYYKYAVNYGMENEFKTEIKQFVTDSVVVVEVKPTVLTGEVTDITMSTAKCAGEVTDEGSSSVTERGVCYSLNINPTVNDSCVSNGVGLGNYAVQLSGLTPNTSYHVRAYAKNENGVSYGDDVKFVTLKEQESDVPVVTTNVVMEITMSTALLGGEVLMQGASHVTSRGVCWGITHNPVPSTGNYKPCGSGIGSFSVTVTDLVPNTIYYVRSYATNSNGTSYGSEVTFITQSEITTDEHVSLTQTTAWCGGTISEGGGASITERGMCWSTNHNPTMEDNYIKRGSGTGTFHVTIEDLSPNSTYYIRACCISGRGISYGNEVEFTTKANLPTVTTNKWPHYWLTTAVLKGSVAVDDGSEVTDRGICWSTEPNPNLNGNHLSCGEGVGEFEAQIENLQEGTQYYYKAYAINREGTAYGEDWNFTTYSRPVVETSDAEVLSDASARIGGVVVLEGSHPVTERGICWSHSPYPNTDGDHSICGEGEGTFSVIVEGLSPNTKYYCRSYAVSSLGKVYGAVKEFTTHGPPSVQTLDVLQVSYNSAVGRGEVTNTGGVEILECGLCWSTSYHPTIDDTHAVGEGNSFSIEMTGLTSLTTYHVRAYAINQYATVYGNDVVFETNPYGTFSVSPTKTVSFSGGNLQYQASTNTWRFADNQYDYIGINNVNISQFYTGWIDLFGWGTSGFSGKYPWMTSTNSSDYGYGSNNIAGTHYDWGVHNTISNGGNFTTGWRTLTKSEWTYIINERNTSSGIRFAKATVNNVNGLILLPDSWTPAIFNLNNTNNLHSSFSSNVISASEWTILEQEGAVFLPTAGYRQGTDVNGVNTYASYWSTTANDLTGAFRLYFNSTSCDVNSGARHYGFSVRLVRDVE